MKRFLRAVMIRSLALGAIRLALPVVAAYICIAGMMAFEIWAVGRNLGPEAVAGVGLGSWLFIVLLMAFHALEIGCQTIVARRFGAKRWREIGAVFDNSLLLALSIGLTLTLVLWRLGPVFLHTADPEVRDFAVSYFRLRLLSLTPLLVVLTLIGFYNGIGRPQISLYGYGASTVINVLLIYVLVLGGFGMESMGVQGAAMASVISVFVGAFFMVLPIVQRGMRRHFRLFRPRNISWPTLRNILSLSYPIFVQNFSVHVALFVFLRINAAIGTVALATTNIAITVGNFSYLPAVGFAVATATLVSQSLGARNPQRATITTLICFSLATIYMVSMGLVFMVAGRSIMGFYLAKGGELTGVTDLLRDQVIDLGGKVLIIIGAVQLFDALGLVFSKALQGAGLTRFVMWVEIFVYWAVFLPVAWVLGVAMDFGALGAWGGFATFLICYGSIMWFKFRKGDWQQTKV